ncbi:MAG: hypothetical protein E3J72_17520 [Planctomycetota bacterium]|nr:MAG: hypothetical protein E3J72_17520 [Planctomycetota bacterium]
MPKVRLSFILLTILISYSSVFARGPGDKKRIEVLKKSIEYDTHKNSLSKGIIRLDIKDIIESGFSGEYEVAEGLQVFSNLGIHQRYSLNNKKKNECIMIDFFVGISSSEDAHEMMFRTLAFTPLPIELLAKSYTYDKDGPGEYSFSSKKRGRAADLIGFSKANISILVESRGNTSSLNVKPIADKIAARVERADPQKLNRLSSLLPEVKTRGIPILTKEVSARYGLDVSGYDRKRSCIHARPKQEHALMLSVTITHKGNMPVISLIGYKEGTVKLYLWVYDKKSFLSSFKEYDVRIVPKPAEKKKDDLPKDKGKKITDDSLKTEISRLIKLISSADRAEEIQAATSLGDIIIANPDVEVRPEDKKKLDKVLDRYIEDGGNYDDDDKRLFAQQQMQRLWTFCTDKMVESINSSNMTKAEAAMKQLILMRNADRCGKLISKFERADDKIRSRIAFTLGKMTEQRRAYVRNRDCMMGKEESRKLVNESVIPFLKKILTSDESKKVRKRTARALRGLGVEVETVDKDKCIYRLKE